MREYEKHQAANGNPPSHAFAKELMAGIAAAEVWKFFGAELVLIYDYCLAM